MNPSHPHPGSIDQQGRVTPSRVFKEDRDEARFWNDGYVIKEFLDPSGVEELLRRFGDLQPHGGFVAAPDLPSQYHCTFLDPDLAYREDVDKLTHDIVDPRIGMFLPGYEVLTGNVYVKPPGTGRFEVHLNWHVVADPSVTTLTIWIPLANMSVESGTIRVVPGSHRLFPDVATAASTQYFAGFENELIESHLVPLELELGQAVIFDDTLIHWSSENLAREPRIALQVEVVPVGSTTAIWVPDPADQRWFKIYAIDRAFFLTRDKSAFFDPSDLPCIGRVPNPNQMVSYSEFCDRLRHGREVRERAYSLPETAAGHGQARSHPRDG